MMPRGFKPVGWVAAVGGAALSCYMLSLNVAAERAELAKIEHRILVAKTEIRALNTELGTRGRLQQLEHWNAEVLALSAPAANQFVENEMMLARFETRQPTIEDKAKVQMASVTTLAPTPAPQPKATPGKKLSPADYAAAADRAAASPKPMLRLASADPSEKPQVIKAAAVKAPEPAPARSETAKAEPKPAAKVTAEPTLAAKPEPKKPAETARAEPKKKPEPTRTASADRKPATPAKAKAQGGAGGQ